MTRPQVYLTRMAMFVVGLAVVVAVLFWQFDTVERAFMENPWFNGPIVGVLVVGIAYVFRQVFELYPVVRWIDTFRREREPGLSIEAPVPSLVAPMATMLGERQGRLSLSAGSMRTLLDGVSSRLDEARDISRYLIALLIFLGLLGTFWGLLNTIFSVGDVIQGLAMTTGDFTTVFEDLKSGLQSPLHGMGIAFSSSLFGLAGSLALGFLDLQASQAQNRFFNDLEEWLSSLTRLAGGGSAIVEEGAASASAPAYVSALLEQTAESLDTLQRTLTSGAESRVAVDSTLTKLTEALAALIDQMRESKGLLDKLVEVQVDVKPAMERLSELSIRDFGGVDEATREHIRNIDVHMARMLEEIAAERTKIAEALRSEIKLLARTIAARNGANPQ